MKKLLFSCPILLSMRHTNKYMQEWTWGGGGSQCRVNQHAAPLFRGPTMPLGFELATFSPHVQSPNVRSPHQCMNVDAGTRHNFREFFESQPGRSITGSHPQCKEVFWWTPETVILQRNTSQCLLRLYPEVNLFLLEKILHACNKNTVDFPSDFTNFSLVSSRKKAIPQSK